MKKELNIIDVCNSEDRIYIYVNGRLFANSSSFPEPDVFQWCNDLQPFAYFYHQMVEDHWGEKDWSGTPDDFSEMTKFLVV